MATSRSKHSRYSPRDIERALSLFSAVRRLMRARFTKGKRVDLSTWLRIETMKFIADKENPKMKEVAAHLSITAPSATSLVQGLVKSGFVDYRVDRDDRRTVRMVLTRKGNTKLKGAVARGVKLARGLFTALSDEEFATFVKTLERIKTANKHSG